MSIFNKILKRDASSLIEESKKKEEAGDLGGAIIACEKAIDHLDKSQESMKNELQSRIFQLKEKLTEKFIQQAQKHFEEGEIELAQENLGFAMDWCVSEEKKEKINQIMNEIAVKVAEAQIEKSEFSMSEEEVYQALSGSWTDEQIEEFDRYGETFKRAYLDFHDGKFEEAINSYKKILEEAGEDALYLKLELGIALHAKAREMAEKGAPPQEISSLRQEAIDIIKDFLNILPKRKTPQVHARAWSLLAQIYIDEGKPEDAEDALIEAQNLLPEEPAVYLNLGRFLLEHERLEDGIVALEQGEKVMDKLHPNLDIWLTLGLAYRKAGNIPAAIERLRAIISFFMLTQRVEFDPQVARPLAEMLEETNSLEEACDLYRNLSVSGEPENLALYNYHAARLMKALGRKTEDILPFILRAKERAGEADLKQKIEELEKTL